MARLKSPYLQLDARRIDAALDQLAARVHERFPNSGLSKLATDVSRLSDDATARAKRLTGPYFGLRLLVLLALVVGVGAEAYLLSQLDWEGVLARTETLSLAQGLESTANLVILSGAAAFFLLNLEERLRRRRVLGALHELRSLAHVVDMHQLTKDPTAGSGPRTSSSPERGMTRFELSRYLDYCAEMLALIAKLAALYAGRTRDPVIVAAVNDVEILSANLSRNIWQKLIILNEA